MILLYYRCFIPECDNFHEPIYDQPWVHYAVPGTTNLDGIFKPQQCEYFIKNNFTQNDLEITYNHDTCPAHWFSQKIDYCNDWVFDNDERTIVQDVSLYIILYINYIFINMIKYYSGV